MILVDASVYIFRAWHALPESITGRGGMPLNVVYGFADFICGLLEVEHPERIAVAFDESLETSFRNELYPAYKANRESAPPELKAQIALCQEMTVALGMTALADARYEADDIIGTLAVRARRAGQAVTIVTSDKDLAQLLQDGDVIWDYAANRRLPPADIRAKFGVDCVQIPDYLGLVGDAVDNVPGVSGVGPKSAVALLNAFDDLDALYADVDAVSGLDVRGAARLRERLIEQRSTAFLSRSLCTIVTDMELPAAAEDVTRRPPDPDALEHLCDAWDFGQRLRGRLLGMVET